MFSGKNFETNTRAVISPHAGYIFSGEVAASAISKIDPDRKYKNVFIVASSHTHYFEGASVYIGGDYETPLGKVKVNTKLTNELVNEHEVFKNFPEPHMQEHGIEVQLPLLQYWLKNDFSIVPIIIGSQDADTPKKLAEALKTHFTGENIFIISTDFSHYPAYEDAVKVDKKTADVICSGDVELFLETINNLRSSGIDNLQTAICGWTSVLTLMYITGKNHEYNEIEYRNSGDSPYGSRDGVVGYWAISVMEKSNNFSFYLNDNDKKVLLQLARNTVEKKVRENAKPDVSEFDFSDNLKQHCGAFVTLHENLQLRGCIGRFEPDVALYEVVMEMAEAAAMHDYRFSLVSENELDQIDYEISVLTPMKKIKSIDEIELGKHGIYIKKGNCSGTFLPQVATETNWTLEEFLGHCSGDKAGLGYTGWRDADIYIYEAIIFSEKDFASEKDEREVKYYEKPDKKKVKCRLCPHNCILSESKTGICKTRQNINGTLRSLSYGKLVALHIDPVEKKPLYHFYPGSETMSFGTAGCNLNCLNCQNSDISQVSPDQVRYVKTSPVQIVHAALENNCNSISYTYTEPTVFYEYMLETAKLAHQYGLKNIMVSNGFINEEPLRELIPYLDAANIDLKCFDDSVYKKMTSAGLMPVLNTLKILKENNVWIEITNLVIPGLTDDMDMIGEMCDWLVNNGFEEVPLHFSRFFPSYKMQDVEPTPVNVVEKAVSLAKSKGIKYVYPGNLRNESIVTNCSNCGENLIERTNFQTKTLNFNGICSKCGMSVNGVWE